MLSLYVVFVFKIYFIIYVYVYLCWGTGACGGQQRALDHLELGLSAIGRDVFSLFFNFIYSI